MATTDRTAAPQKNSESRSITPPVFLRREPIDYTSLYSESIKNPEAFWGKVAESLVWEKKWDKVLEFNPPYHEWFLGARTNITINCLDRHIVGERRNKVALIVSGESGPENYVTYDRLLRRVNQVANAMKNSGVVRGDRVLVYMPNTSEAIYVMLACARIGAIHVTVSQNVGARGLRARLADTQAKVVFCADVAYRHAKHIPMMGVLNDSLYEAASVEKIVVLRRQNPKLDLHSEREVDFYEFVEGQSQYCNPEIVEANHPLFILYTSGTSGAPKGVVHVHGGYMTGVSYMTKQMYDLQENDIFWNMYQLGSVPGHAYSVYGTLMNGATVMIREGALDFPAEDNFWRNIERHGVNILFTHPSTLQSLSKFSSSLKRKFDLSSLRLIATTGGALQPDLHAWAQRELAGKIGCVIDTWWQTEIAAPAFGNLLTYPVKLGKVGKAMPGVTFDLVGADGKSVPPDTSGLLALRFPLPHLMNTIWNADERYRKYWKHVPNAFNTGDMAMCDADGHLSFIGRVDDVVKVSGYRIAMAELEGTLQAHPAVKEAAVIGLPDEEKGEIVKAFIVLKNNANKTDALKITLRDYVRHELGAAVAPDKIEYRDTLPRTQDGSIAHSLLKAGEMSGKS
jgi:acetyl-CoA synthetase